jgi:hypothetical protein
LNFVSNWRKDVIQNQKIFFIITVNLDAKKGECFWQIWELLKSLQESLLKNPLISFTFLPLTILYKRFSILSNNFKIQNEIPLFYFILKIC